MIKKAATVLAGISLLYVLLPGKAYDFQEADKAYVLGSNTQKAETNTKASPELAANLEQPTLTAKSALAFDLGSGSILYTKNFDEKLPIASLTKLMTALVVVENVQMNDIVSVAKEDIQVIGTNVGLLPGEKMTVYNLLQGMLILSGNDAASVLAKFTGDSQNRFVELMNQKASKMGLHSTSFGNSTGLDSPGNYSTAFELGKIVEEFVRNPVLGDIVKTRETVINSVDGNIEHKIKSTNKLLLENDNIVGIKTGFTTNAKGNLILRAKNSASDVVTIVLGSENREEDSRLLLNWILNVYRW